MSILIRLEDHPEPIEASEGDLILDALLLAGVPMPYSCQQGNCGTCKCELVEGEVMELDYSEYALSLEERAKGLILACRTQAWGDVTVRKLDDEELMLHPERFMRCKVARIKDLTHDIKQVVLEIESGGPYTFTAGQYAKIEFLPLSTRDYSMANLPAGGDQGRFLAFHVRAVPGGAVSRFVHDKLAPGQTVRVSGPYGASYLREKHQGALLAIAGGSGLAPIKSIIGRALAVGSTQPMHLYFGVRALRDVYHEDLFKRWAAQHPNFRYTIVLSNEEVDGYAHGLVTDVVARDLDAIGGIEGVKAYLAGPPVMVEAATQLLNARGMESRHIHADAFYTTADRQTNAA